MNKQTETIMTEEDDTGTGSGYASDQEGENEHPAMPETFSSYLNGIMFDSDDDDDDDIMSTTSKEAMPPPKPAFTSSSSSDNGVSSPPSGRGYASGDSSTSTSPLTSSGSESPPSSDEERWELHYLNKKRKLLTKALNMMKREEVYNASIAGCLVTRTAFDTPLWREAKTMTGYKENVTHHSSIHQRSLLGNKRPRIDLSSVYHVKGDIHSEIFMPQMCTVEAKESPLPRPATPTLVTSEEENTVERNTTDLTHAITFTPVAQVLAQADDIHTIVYANRAFSEFSGLSTTEIVGKSLESIVVKRNGDNTCDQDDFCDAKVTTSTSSGRTHRKCQMKTILVKEAPPRKSPETFASPVKAQDSPVTHYLVQLKALVQIAEPEVRPRAARRSTQKVSSNRLLETVG